VIKRTSTFVSTARNALPHVAPNATLQLRKATRAGRASSKYCPMQIFGRVSAGSPHHNPPRVFVPFEDGPRADAKLAAHRDRHGDLPLGCESGASEHHAAYYHGNGRQVENTGSSGLLPRVSARPMRASYARSDEEGLDAGNVGEHVRRRPSKHAKRAGDIAQSPYFVSGDGFVLAHVCQDTGSGYVTSVLCRSRD